MKIWVSFLFLAVIFSSCRQAPVHHSEFLWKPYSKEAIAKSVAAHKPVLLDFWAEWCPNCHDMDREVFARPEIQAKLAQVTALRVDVTDQDNPEVQKILQEYDIEGVPTTVFIDSHGHEITEARLIGLVTPKEFSQAFALLKVFR